MLDSGWCAQSCRATLNLMSQTTFPPIFPAQIPEVRVSVDGGDIIASGSVVVTTPDKVIDFQIANLLYKLKFRSDETGISLTIEDQNPSGYSIVLHNFDNSLGTSIKPMNIGTVNGRKLWLTAFVVAIAGASGPRVVSYALYLGGELG